MDDLIDEDRKEREGEVLAEHLTGKGLHDLLEATLDPMTTEEFGSGACLYHAFVSIIAHENLKGDIEFQVLHPADDRDICPVGKPDGFSVPWEFNSFDTAKKVRRLAAAANSIYRSLGLLNELPTMAQLQIPKCMFSE